MHQRAFRLLTATALLLGVCCHRHPAPADEAPAEAPTRAHAEPSAGASHAGSASPEEATTRWLEAVKRRDTDAMSALYSEEVPKARRFAPGNWRSVSWEDLGRDRTGSDAKTRISVHVVFTGADGVVHPENFGFDFVQRDGRWWMVGVSHID